MNNFNAISVNIKELFTNDLTYNIPSYQRPYSREKDQVVKFCEDVLASYFRNKEEYLLSSIILIDQGNDLYDVVDGQQRLTTISIFLAVLKSVIDENIQGKVKQRIFKENSQDLRINRITTDPSKVDGFSHVLQNFDYQAFKAQMQDNKLLLKDRYYANAITIYDVLHNKENHDDDFNFNDFYTFFESKIYLIKVVVAEQSKAMRLFEVLNARGLPLSNTDLIKNHLIEKIYEDYKNIEDAKTKQREFVMLWKRAEDEMKKVGENVEDLFTYYVYYKLAENPKRTAFEEFKYIFTRDFDTFESFRCEFVQFFDCYISLYSKDKKTIQVYRIIHSMKYLKEGRFWKTILTSHSMTYPTDTKGFALLVNELFRFYYLNWIAGETVNPYKQLSFRLIKSITTKTFDVSVLRSAFDIYISDKTILARVTKRLHENVYGESRIKPLLILLEYCTKESESDHLFDAKKITIEHIYAQKSQEKNNDLATNLHTLGNVTLLYGGRNAKLGNKSFADKKAIFLQQNPADFGMTNEVFSSYNDWTLEDIDIRKSKLLTMIEKIFDITGLQE